MHLTFAKSLCGLLLAAAISPLWAADFAPKDARATLSVEYVYLSNGKKSDKYDSHEQAVKLPGSIGGCQFKARWSFVAQ